MMPRHTIIPRHDRREERFVSECTVRQLTQEEIERLDKLLGPPRMPLKSKRPLAAMQQRATNPRDVKQESVKEPDTVYITAHASVYHISPNCYKARGAVQKSLTEAKKQGLKMCGWCKMRLVQKGEEVEEHGQHQN